MTNNKVAIILGSKSDIGVAEKAEKILREFGIEYATHIMSAHRTPNKVKKFASEAEQNGIGVIIAIAGLSAHLPGVLSSMTILPIIGVPVGCGPLAGEDALYSIVQMPSGIPVASVGIDNGTNAALFAVEILSVGDVSLREKMRGYRTQFGDTAA
jgi:phosphoribosylaminoimidazole carboxylase PurE protein